MSLNDRTAQPHLTPEARRELLRAFADRMLLKVTSMDDPEDMPGVEKAVRTAAMIERIYSRCDRAERQTEPSRKVDAERAIHEVAAIKAQVSLAGTLRWSEERRRDLGQWWEAAANATKAAAKAPVVPQTTATPDKIAEIPLNSPPSCQKVTYTDLTDDIEAARAELASQRQAAAKSGRVPHSPFGGPPSRSG